MINVKGLCESKIALKVAWSLGSCFFVIARIGPIQRAAMDTSLKTKPSNFNVCMNYPETLLKGRLCYSSSWGCLRLCISRKLPGDATALFPQSLSAIDSEESPGKSFSTMQVRPTSLMFTDQLNRTQV